MAEAGESPSTVMPSLGLCRTTIYPWLRDFKKHGWEALAESIPQGSPPKLTEGQQQRVKRWILGEERADQQAQTRAAPAAETPVPTGALVVMMAGEVAGAISHPVALIRPVINAALCRNLKLIPQPSISIVTASGSV